MAYNNKKLFWFLLLIFLVLGLFCFELVFKPIPAASTISNKSAFLKKGIIYLKGNKLNIEVAESDDERFRGLSGRESLCDNCGMLFNFETKERQNFVMRDMKFPLDIIFIDDDQIINIASNLAPEGHNPKNIYSSISDANQVLEVNGGYCSKLGIGVGDNISKIEIN